MILNVHHLLGATEIAERLGLTRQRVQQLAKEPDFPQPAAILKAGNVWNTDDIRAWALEKGREFVDPPPAELPDRVLDRIEEER